MDVIQQLNSMHDKGILILNVIQQLNSMHDKGILILIPKLIRTHNNNAIYIVRL
jgi:hypothetical protein